jgi:hypothetical protein
LQGYANMSTVAGIKSLDVYILSSPSIHPSFFTFSWCYGEGFVTVVNWSSLIDLPYCHLFIPVSTLTALLFSNISQPHEVVHIFIHYLPFFPYIWLTIHRITSFFICLICVVRCFYCCWNSSVCVVSVSLASVTVESGYILGSGWNFYFHHRTDHSKATWPLLRLWLRTLSLEVKRSERETNRST